MVVVEGVNNVPQNMWEAFKTLQSLYSNAQKYLLKGKYDAQMLAESILYSIKRKRSEITQTAPV